MGRYVRFVRVVHVRRPIPTKPRPYIEGSDFDELRQQLGHDRAERAEGGVR
jgi:hypothetical protein